jgi:hypothetical protein
MTVITFFSRVGICANRFSIWREAPINMSENMTASFRREVKIPLAAIFMTFGTNDLNAYLDKKNLFKSLKVSLLQEYSILKFESNLCNFKKILFYRSTGRTLVDEHKHIRTPSRNFVPIASYLKPSIR